jgi:hypothetical protein
MGTLSSVKTWYVSGREAVEKNCFLGFEAAGGLDGWGEDRLNPVVAEICFPSHIVSNKDESYWPFGRFELHGRVVRLFVSGHTAHVSNGNANQSGHVGVVSNCFRGQR